MKIYMINALPKHGYINRMVNMGLCPPCKKKKKTIGWLINDQKMVTLIGWLINEVCYFILFLSQSEEFCI
jgi:hypothetical protein